MERSICKYGPLGNKEFLLQDLEYRRVAHTTNIQQVAIPLVQLLVALLYELFTSTLGHITDVVGIIYHKDTSNIPLTANT